MVLFHLVCVQTVPILPDSPMVSHMCVYMCMCACNLNRYWLQEEHDRFLEALQQHGPKAMKAISDHVATRTPVQVYKRELCNRSKSWKSETHWTLAPQLPWRHMLYIVHICCILLTYDISNRAYITMSLNQSFKASSLLGSSLLQKSPYFCKALSGSLYAHSPALVGLFLGWLVFTLEEIV